MEIERLKNACYKGKSNSNGGLNITEIKIFLTNLSPEQSVEIMSASRSKLEEICKSILENKKDHIRDHIRDDIRDNRKVPVNIEEDLEEDVEIYRKPIKVPAPRVRSEGRLSASAYYDKYGKTSIGDRCNIRKDGEYKCLLMTSTGSPRWELKTSNVIKQAPCEDFSPRCKDIEFN